MSCKKYKMRVGKEEYDNKKYLDAEDKESKKIAREFKKKTRLNKKL